MTTKEIVARIENCVPIYPCLWDEFNLYIEALNIGINSVEKIQEPKEIIEDYDKSHCIDLITARQLLDEFKKLLEETE